MISDKTGEGHFFGLFLGVAAVFGGATWPFRRAFKRSDSLLLIPVVCLQPVAMYNSQACQDEFVDLIINGVVKKPNPHFYLEIGAGHPVRMNNSLCLENLGWNGVSIDIDDKWKDEWKQKRKNPLLVTDALKLNYAELLLKFPPTVDYLSLDIDADYDKVLEILPFSVHTFSVATIEHDRYRSGTDQQEKERKIMENNGYKCVCSNVKCCGGGLPLWVSDEVPHFIRNLFLAKAEEFKDTGPEFEDWYIHFSVLTPEQWQIMDKLDLASKSGRQIIDTIRKSALF